MYYLGDHIHFLCCDGGKETIEQRPSTSWDYTPCPFGEIQGISYFYGDGHNGWKKELPTERDCKKKKGIGWYCMIWYGLPVLAIGRSHYCSLLKKGQ